MKAVVHLTTGESVTVELDDDATDPTRPTERAMRGESQTLRYRQWGKPGIVLVRADCIALLVTAENPGPRKGRR